MIKIYSKPPAGFELTDPVRTREQGEEFVKGGYQDSLAVLVRTGKKGDVFPYHIYTKPLRRM
jgi:hypothetical protein